MEQKSFQASEYTFIEIRRLVLPDGPSVVLSFYPTGAKSGMPGFNMCFSLEKWREFQREVADFP